MQTINAQTSIYGVIGDPVGHSLSPVMHNAAFAALGYNGVYTAFNVKALDSAIAGIRALGIKGVSVTIPHKVDVIELLDWVDPTARAIGAVNTIVNDNGKLSGYNTDCTGAVQAILEKTGIKGKKVVMIGAGGAARAVGYGIVSEGGLLTIANILEDEGERLAGELGVPYYPLTDFDRLDYHILVNTTPVGMSPDTEDIPVPAGAIKKGAVVMDIIYNPLQTRLLKEAGKRNCMTVDGVSMFVRQGAAQFEMWTKQKAPLALMRRTVIDALQ